ncbi:MAG TPA: hypothetical protein VGD55_00060 [Acidothermaceae bacterium]
MTPTTTERHQLKRTLREQVETVPSERAHPFQEWLQAIADLTRAEARGADDAERERLSAEVGRARGAVEFSLGQ